ncbi:MAG: phosphoribosylformylglycinamidine synthase subunit PurQ [Coriobacteriia bacterium]|nr:phosphoribosylformylglycinamidine synthase subunit PurQ [Coriobacteriia bacterium]
MRFGIVRFPGSNCEQDVAHAVTYLEQDFTYIWHEETSLGEVDAVVLPGGFSYGDYLRCGAVARFSPVMEAVTRFAHEGGPVLGICNGFQILTEARLLPGALIRNEQMKFICKPVSLRVEASCDWLDKPQGTVLTVPINHGEGNYVCDERTLAQLHASNQVIVRYCAPDGSDIARAPNGATDGIAGICNEQRNVFGLMPHPERVTDPISENNTGCTDGATFFTTVIERFA